MPHNLSKIEQRHAMNRKSNITLEKPDTRLPEPAPPRQSLLEWLSEKALARHFKSTVRPRLNGVHAIFLAIGARNGQGAQMPETIIQLAMVGAVEALKNGGIISPPGHDWRLKSKRTIQKWFLQEAMAMIQKQPELMKLLEQSRDVAEATCAEVDARQGKGNGLRGSRDPEKMAQLAEARERQARELREALERERAVLLDSDDDLEALEARIAARDEAD